ncbi:ABC transporter ATP-binding protein [Herbaspirillum sp. BH-1]|uniref:Branched-chain amino acid transport system ATP-binding protein n=1 Tax=Herbaspirillum frisingense TaxID=92645 RepID=A0ABU1PHC5_9BURK|nr:MULTISPECIES: ABC transporter ATP-binding protein [Herbaspirillum]MDR6585324.1 branched-chain amino acid transport system ATP-binding protein [Herbaspirillum frisingense]PLY59085.1 ABC transporter ATP-binding protein [Herbaspirillum sp. BH-1]
MIMIDKLVAGYSAEVDILKGMSLHAQHAEIITLLGPNGCGKSTLLKTIAGFLRPRQGSITLQGEDISAQPVHHKIRHGGIGFVPQTENVFAALSVRENLQVGGHYLSSLQARQRMEQLCEDYPVLRRKFNAPAASLSGGERQILALARALMPRPRLLLLDEPSAGLSPKVLLEVFDAICTVRDKEQVTILMVEQNAMEALRISDRAYVLSMGTVALSGKAGELMHDPQVRELYLGGRAA